ncbi:hypothetical protein ACFY3O_32850 [Streptomyces sp. NPDC001046]|uniref:hypothetical protein n=1 Tax=Streptomyces sp. NPDC001046 TaxID=3364543 RepID=UPI00368477FC
MPPIDGPAPIVDPAALTTAGSGLGGLAAATTGTTPSDPAAARPADLAPAPSDAPALDGDRFRDALAEQFAPGTASLSPTKRRRTRAAVLTVTCVVAVCGVLLGLLGDYVYELATADSTLKSEQDAEDRLDRQETPFTAVASPDTSALDEDAWTIVLDRTLNPGEVRTLLTLDAEADDFGRRVWGLLGPLGGRVIGATPVMPKAAQHPYGPTTFFTLNLFSKRKSPVSITGMRAVKVHCAPSTVQTVVRKPNAGESAYSGVLFDLTGTDSAHAVPVVTDEGPDQARPYFDHRRIDLGGGLEPGGLRVAAVVTGETCDWDIEATYTDADGRHTGMLLRNKTKHFRAESWPVSPPQRFVYDIAPHPKLLPCHEKRYAAEVACSPDDW